MLPYFSLSQMVFGSFQDLSMRAFPKERQAAALVRLVVMPARSAAMSPSRRSRARAPRSGIGDAALIAPWNIEVEQDLQNQDRFLKGTRDLLAGQRPEGMGERFRQAREAS